VLKRPVIDWASVRDARGDSGVVVGDLLDGTAVAGGDMTLAGGLTYLFGRAVCSGCGSRFGLADWFEADHGPAQPIDPVGPRTDRSLPV
jgi:hypothetical protein